MSERVKYEGEGGIASIAMDDGKANVLSPAMLAELNAALDQAEADHAVVVLSGRERIFSGGFDLAVLQGGGADALDMLRGGFELSARLLGFATPVVMACAGHAVAMGSFLLLSGDYRIGAEGEYQILANEVSIGLTLPQAAVEICRHRLSHPYFDRATILSTPFAPDEALAAGFLDRVVPVADLLDTAHEVALGFTKLDMNAHAATKLRVRGPALEAIRAGIESDDAALRALL